MCKRNLFYRTSVTWKLFWLPVSVFVSASFPLSRKCGLQARNYPPLRRTLTLFQLNHYLQCQNSALWECHVTFILAFYWLVWTCTSMLEIHWWTCFVLLQPKIFRLVKRRDNYFQGWYCVFYSIEMQTKKHIQLLSQFWIFGDTSSNVEQLLS